MRLKFLISLIIFSLATIKLFAQKPITSDVDFLKLHLNDYKDFDASTKTLLNTGYTKISWPIAKGKGSLKNSAYKLLVEDSVEKIIELIHSVDKRVFEVNLYIGYMDKKWATYTDAQKTAVLLSFFVNIRDLINKEYGTTEKGQRKVWGNYKDTDYNVPKTLLKGMDDRDLGYFVSWGPFGKYPIELESYNSQYIVITVRDPQALSAYFTTPRK